MKPTHIVTVKVTATFAKSVKTSLLSALARRNPDSAYYFPGTIRVQRLVRRPVKRRA